MYNLAKSPQHLVWIFIELAICVKYCLREG